MRVAVASSNGKDVDLHFGKAKTLFVYDLIDENNIKFIEKRNVDIFDEVKHQSTKVIDAVSDCETVIVVKYGPTTKLKAKKANLKIIEDEGPIKEVLERYIDHVKFMKGHL
ncbi:MULTISPECIES: NifB/NifX family molybdenum-iron cluster-binding protein [unclassified Methanobrevibacter]|uniref:NifB/NifX family molybdenum-iron cluster-binding protein n=1 Tax=unclassified Methanobrevibacter TaxID=2638681 RepID=UPI0039B9C1AB